MRFAVKEGDFITNVIVANEEQKQELELALDAELLDAAPLNLSIGDYYREGIGWTRNQDGEQTVLTERPTYNELAEGLRSLGVEPGGKEEFFAAVGKQAEAIAQAASRAASAGETPKAE
jgi:hypothetical protein